MHLGFSTPGFNSHSFATAVEPIIGSALFTRILRSEPQKQELLFLRALYLKPLVKNPAVLSKLVFGETAEPRFEIKLIPANLPHWSIDIQAGGKVVLRSPSSSDKNEPAAQAMYFTTARFLELAESKGLARLASAFKDWLQDRFYSGSDLAGKPIEISFACAVLCEMAKIAPDAVQAVLENELRRYCGFLPQVCARVTGAVFSENEQAQDLFWSDSDAVRDISQRLLSHGEIGRFGVACRLDKHRAVFMPGECEKIIEIAAMICHRLARLAQAGDCTDISLKVLLGYQSEDGPLPLYPQSKYLNLEIPAKFRGCTDGLGVIHALSALHDDSDSLCRILNVIGLLRENHLRRFWFGIGHGPLRLTYLNLESLARAVNWHKPEEVADAVGLSITLTACGSDVFSKFDAIAGFVKNSSANPKDGPVDARRVGYLVRTARYLREVIGDDFYDQTFQTAQEKELYLNFAMAAYYFAELVESSNFGIDDSAVKKVLQFGYKNQAKFNEYHRTCWREAKDFHRLDDEALSSQLLRAGLLRELAKRVALPPTHFGVESFENELRFIDKVFAAVGKDAETEAEAIWSAAEKQSQVDQRSIHQLEFGWSDNGPLKPFVAAVVVRLERHFVHAFYSGIIQGVIDPSQGFEQSYASRKLKVDNPPYPSPRGRTESYSLEYRRCFRESLSVGYSALELYHGQGALMFAGRRCHPQRSTQIEQFALSCAASFHSIEGRGVVYPGSGYVMSGLNLASIFPVRELEDKYIGLSALYPWAREVLPDADRSTIAYVRGFRAVLPPENDILHLVHGHRCALISFQDHFGDPDIKGVFLVSREAASRFLVAYREGRQDFSEGASAVLEYLRVFSPKNFPPLCLSWISNLGGLCNAWPPGSAPLWNWENDVRGTTDFVRHIHKSYVSGRYQSEWNPAIEREFERFATAHSEIYAVANRLFATEKLWRVAMTRFSMGHFFGGEDGEDIYQQRSELYYPKFGAFMLGRAINWNKGLKERGVVDSAQYPVLVIANPLDHWGRSSAERYLDSHELELRTPEGLYNFGPEISAEAEEVWIDRFWSKAEQLGFEIRAEHRERLGL